MARIRTIKPELFRHEELFDLEQETGLPIRVAWMGLFTICDREGRFKLRPRTIQSEIMPFDKIDFGRVLHALVTRGFLVAYACSGENYACIPTFKNHQVINNKERPSLLPSHEAPESQLIDTTFLLTRESRVTDASPSRDQDGKEERKGKEGKGKEGKESPSVSAQSAGAQQLIAVYLDEWERRYRTKPPRASGKDAKQLKTLVDTHGFDEAKRLVQAYLQMPDTWFMTRTHAVDALVTSIPKVTLFANSGKMISRSEIRQLDENVSTQNLIESIRRDGI